MTADPIRDKAQLQRMVELCRRRGKLRDCALIVLGVHTALRIGDLLRLRWADVYDFDRGQFRSHLDVTEEKTGKRKSIAIHRQAAHALAQCLAQTPDMEGDFFLFSARCDPRTAMDRTTAWRIVRAAATAAGVEGHISCHSLRKSFGYHAWKEGVPLAVITEIYNHSSYAITRRYLGIAQDDCDNAYLSMRFFESQ